MAETGSFGPVNAGAGLPHRWIDRKAGFWGTQAVLAGCLAAVAAALGGCTNQYRPVVSAISPVGPARQPQKYAFAVSNPNELTAGGTRGGLLTVVDFAGDTVLATPAILPNPTYFAELEDGSSGFAINQQNSLNAIPLGTPSSLIASLVVQTTLPANVAAPSLTAFTLNGTPRILIPQTDTSGVGSVSVFSAASPALQQQISVSPNPVYVVGNNNTPRAYVLSQGATPGVSAGQVAAIEAGSLSVSTTINVGLSPVYGVETIDNRRAFVLNQGSGTVSVINVTNNAIDSANPTVNLNINGVTGLQPVWADLAPNANQLIVVSKRAGNANGYLSVINIPLCNAVAQPTNPTCDPNNPIDGVGFGQVLSTVPVGVNPTQVAVLVDGSQAYVANQGVPGTSQTTEVEGSVSAVNLVSGTVINTITGVTAFDGTGAVNPIAVPPCSVVAPATGASQACVYGHPTTIAATTGSPTGKVYVTAPDSNYLTVIETDTDTVATHVNLQGVGVRVQVSVR